MTPQPPECIAQSLNPNGEKCARCGNVATGLAYIGKRRYCLGDWPGQDCYALTVIDEAGELVIPLASQPEETTHE